MSDVVSGESLSRDQPPPAQFPPGPTRRALVGKVNGRVIKPGIRIEHEALIRNRFGQRALQLIDRRASLSGGRRSSQIGDSAAAFGRSMRPFRNGAQRDFPGFTRDGLRRSCADTIPVRKTDCRARTDLDSNDNPRRCKNDGAGKNVATILSTRRWRAYVAGGFRGSAIAIS